MKASIASAVFCLAAVSLPGLAAEESRLDLKYGRVAQAQTRTTGSTQPPAAVAAPPPKACTVLVHEPADLRRNKDTLGTTFADNPIVSSQSPSAWLQAALLDLTRQGYTTMPAAAPAAPPATRIAALSVDLDRLYVWNHSLNLHATLVVKATITGGGGETLIRRYRVNSTKLNWWNADSEFIDTINLAAARLLEQLADDIDGVCSPRKGG